MRFEKIHEDAIIPSYQTQGSAGMDLHSVQDAIILNGSWAIVRTGLVFHGLPGFEAQIRPRSGLAAKHGITVLNSPGTIDSDYKGEIGVILINHGPSSFYIEKGDRIAQMVIAPIVIINDLVQDNVRATGGFGSTGL